jgi:tRNA G46 methylase TrmB
MAALDNLYVINGDARSVLSLAVPDNSIDEVFINYPVPPCWPGSKRRLIDENVGSSGCISIVFAGCFRRTRNY